MDDYLTKPIDSQRLFGAVERVTRASDATPQHELVSFDKADVLRRLDGDEELLREIVRLFLDDSPSLVESMRVAANAHDRKGLRTAAHRMKGAAANLAATALAEAARALEILSESGEAAEIDGAWRRVHWENDRIHAVLRAEMMVPNEPTGTES
jgi:HPt (histidine-containing phosphotransfer) domain-containing protein